MSQSAADVSKIDSMTKRLQINVPDEIAKTWAAAAAATGVSLSNWVTMRTNRLDCERILTQLTERLDRFDDRPRFDAEECDMINSLARENEQGGRPLTLEQVLRLGVRAAYRVDRLNSEDVEKVVGRE